LESGLSAAAAASASDYPWSFSGAKEARQWIKPL
jgi:hypothetical protein